MMCKGATNIVRQKSWRCCYYCIICSFFHSFSQSVTHSFEQVRCWLACLYEYYDFNVAVARIFHAVTQTTKIFSSLHALHFFELRGGLKWCNKVHTHQQQPIITQFVNSISYLKLIMEPVTRRLLIHASNTPKVSVFGVHVILGPLRVGQYRTWVVIKRFVAKRAPIRVFKFATTNYPINLEKEKSWPKFRVHL